MALSPAQSEKLRHMSKEQLLAYIDMLQKNWWNLQNNYILYLNNKYGDEAAIEADAHCFSANARVQAYRLKKLFDLKDDLQALKDVMVLSTIWANADYEITEIDDQKFNLKVTTCHQQVRRLEDGLGEIPCKPAGIAICEAAAGAINPRASVKCLVCPPDEHPEDVWCEWEFRLPE